MVGASNVKRTRGAPASTRFISFKRPKQRRFWSSEAIFVDWHAGRLV